MTPEELRTLTLFNTVESSPGINQRQLARELDVSLGLTNTYFQRVLKKVFSHSKGSTGKKPSQPLLPAPHP